MLEESYAAESRNEQHEMNQSGVLAKEAQTKPKNRIVVLNSLNDNDLLSKLDLENRINKINNKMNSIVKGGCIPTNPSTFETELGS